VIIEPGRKHAGIGDGWAARTLSSNSIRCGDAG
jgi:hypothetical protein